MIPCTNRESAAAEWAASLGCVGCVLRYRVPPAHPWPMAREDLEAAAAYLRSAEAAARWAVDPSRLVVLGFSAGAHLAAQLAATGERRPCAVTVYVR